MTNDEWKTILTRFFCGLCFYFFALFSFSYFWFISSSFSSYEYVVIALVFIHFFYVKLLKKKSLTVYLIFFFWVAATVKCHYTTVESNEKNLRFFLKNSYDLLHMRFVPNRIRYILNKLVEIEYEKKKMFSLILLFIKS